MILDRKCWVCSQPHWVNGELVSGTSYPDPYPCREHQEAEFRLWQSIRELDIAS